MPVLSFKIQKLELVLFHSQTVGENVLTAFIKDVN